MVHVILFEHINFHGAHKHVVGAEPNLNASDDGFFNDRVSSIAIFSGNWQFSRDSGFRNPYPVILGPGLYSNVAAFKIKNDDMSSLQPVSDRPTMAGAPLDNHIILFEHIKFHGAHKHVFTPEPNLNASDDSFFNDRVSSLAVLNGNWVFFRDFGFNHATQYPPVLGPGGYPVVDFVGIKNDDMSALQPVNLPPTVRNPERIDEGLILYEHANFHGAHKHLVTSEVNLNASDDSFFNDKTSSIAVLHNQWKPFRNSGFQTPYVRAGHEVVLPVGIYPSVEAVGVTNDDISSLSALL